MTDTRLSHDPPAPETCIATPPHETPWSVNPLKSGSGSATRLIKRDDVWQTGMQDG